MANENASQELIKALMRFFPEERQSRLFANAHTLANKSPQVSDYLRALDTLRLIPLSQVVPHLAFEERRTRSGAGAGILREA